MQQNPQADPLTTLSTFIGALSQKLDEANTRIQELEETIQKMRVWAVKVQKRLPPPKKTRIPPANTITTADIARAYKIINTKTGRNYQADSNYGKMCRHLMQKHGVDTVCQVLAYACRQNGERGSEEWSRPSTLFRASNFARWLDEVVSANGQ